MNDRPIEAAQICAVRVCPDMDAACVEVPAHRRCKNCPTLASAAPAAATVPKPGLTREGCNYVATSFCNKCGHDHRGPDLRDAKWLDTPPCIPTDAWGADKVKCEQCGRFIAWNGLKQHRKDAHSGAPAGAPTAPIRVDRLTPCYCERAMVPAGKVCERCGGAGAPTKGEQQP